MLHSALVQTRFGVVMVLVGWMFSTVAQGQTQPAREGTGSMQAMIRAASMGLVERATTAERGGHPLEAEALYRRAAETDPNVIAAHLGLARTLGLRGRQEEGAGVLRGASSRAMGDDAAVVLVSDGFVALGHLDDALTLLGSVTGRPVVTRALVALCAQQGRFQEALPAARRLREELGERASDDASVMVRALVRIVGEGDVVTAPPGESSAFRRLVAEAGR